MIHELDTKIDQVKIFQSGVRITRTGLITLEAGEQTIKIPKLTEFLDKESVRVKGQGHGTIVNVNVSKHTTTASKNPKKDELQEKLKKSKQELEHLKQDFSRIATKKDRLGEFSNTFYQRVPVYYGRHGLAMEKIYEMENYLQKQEDEIIAHERKLEDNQQSLMEEITLIQKELQQLGYESQIKQFYEIAIRLNVSQACEFSFTLEFQHPQAAWKPFYDVNLSEKNAQVKLLADVINNSGEDWNDVTLEISSASLQKVRIQKPHPLIVSEYVPQPIMSKSRKSALGGSKRLAAAPMMMKAMEEAPRPTRADEPSAPPPPMVEQFAKIDESLGTASYTLPTRLSIPSDNNPHPVTLMEKTLESMKGYFWSIVSPEQVIIQDTLTNQDTLLLPGNAKVYFDGEYIGETEIPLIAPHETVKLGTRRTYDLKIKKNLVERKRAKEGILKGKISKHYKYEIEIQNLKKQAYHLTIMDRMVHSDSEKIKIANEKFSIQPQKYELGVLTWEINLEEIDNLIISYEYEVIWEKDIRITPPLP